MTANLSIRDFLHDILANKARAKLTIEEFDSLLKMADEVKKFSQKGLLIVTLAEQLHKMSNVNYVSIKKFMNEFLAGLKPEKPRRQREEVSHRRRRQRPADKTNVPRDINGMAEESISNPSNLEMVRLGVEAPSQESSINIASENISKRSDQNKKDFEFAQQLNKISEGVELITGQQDFEHQQDENIEEYSKASSSSQSFGVVSNLSEKMDLLKHRQQNGEKKTKTVRRPAGVEATMTKKKGARGNVVDENLTLEKTKATLNDTVYEQQRPMSYEYSPWINEYHEASDLFEKTEDEFIKVTKVKPLSLLSNMMLSAKKNEERREIFDIPTELTQFDTGYQGDTIYDFTSQPIPQFSEQMEASQFQMNSLSIFNYEDANPTLDEISSKVNKPRTLVFYEMLSKMQKGEVVMNQENINDFGEIKVQLLM